MANGTVESCELSRRNKDKIDTLEKYIETLKNSSNEEIKAVGMAIERLRDRYANRLPAYGTAIIAALSTLCGVLATMLIRRA